LILLIGLGCARFAYGAGRASLLVTDTEVIVRNPLKTDRFPISVVERFDAGLQPSAGQGTPGVLVVLDDGSVARVWTLANEGLVWNFRKHIERWAPVAASLTGLLPKQPPVPSAGAAS
jgi:hypothetical protein